MHGIDWSSGGNGADQLERGEGGGERGARWSIDKIDLRIQNTGRGGCMYSIASQRDANRNGRTFTCTSLFHGG